MNPEVIAKAYRAIGQGYYEAADVLLEAASAPEAVLARPVAVSEMPDFPPFEVGEPVYEAIPLPSDAPGLGRCPSHGEPWSVKGAGVSKTGKAYTAFWKCDGKTDGVFCAKKPTRAWADAHPIQGA